GVPLDENMNYTGSFFGLLRPLPLLVGITGVFMLCTQGASYLLMKTEGDFYGKVQSWVRKSWLLFLITAALTTVFTAVFHSSKMGILLNSGFGYLALIILVLSVVSLPMFLKRQANFRVFAASSLIILAMFLIVAVTIFPNMVPSVTPGNSLTIYNAASSQKTLTVMLVIAAIGMPIVLTYTTFVYRLFRK
ncbi:MAG: cytochrome d ubiquinol oxidase subunit II, partial [Proteobacteria bacterium]|nr:cytochrome d ubiquinol oxidase subunit II [Pseudomonadota bacterium]